MTCNIHHVRRLTARERAERDARQAAQYDRIYSEIEQAERDEYEESFGPTFKEKHPYRLNHDRLHDLTLRKMREEEVGIHD